jgi:hypothetical protein
VNVPSNATVSREDALSFSGWAVDLGRKKPVLAVCATIDGRAATAAHATYGSARPDVAGNLGISDLSNVGYTIALPPHFFTSGRHTLRAFAVLPGDATGMLTGAFDITVR